MAIILGENAYIDLATWKAWADQRNYDYSARAKVTANLIHNLPV